MHTRRSQCSATHDRTNTDFQVHGPGRRETTVYPLSAMSDGDESVRRVAGSSRSSTLAISQASDGRRSAGIQWTVCHALLVAEQQVTLSPAIQAVAASSEAFFRPFLCELGYRSRARGSDGLYLEHVLRDGSVMAASRKMRQSSRRKVVQYAFFYRYTPGTPPRTPMCILTVFRGHSGAGGPDGRICRPRRFPGSGKGLRETRRSQGETATRTVLGAWS